VPALAPYLIEPIFEQFSALLPEREVDHPLGCHRPRIPERVVFEKLVQVLVFGCAYERIAERTCSATTLRDRREEWIELGVMDALRESALEAYAIASSGWRWRMWQWSAASPKPHVAERRQEEALSTGESKVPNVLDGALDARGIPLGTITAPANQHD
jgi:hypothetical protein